MAAALSLDHFRVGERIGKGAFGHVYKALHWSTGETVAIKVIKLDNLAKGEMSMFESEVELLKNLNHENIVKYIGFVKSPDSLNILLEYCENGSLHSICKSYGKFPENLVGVYMAQVLTGLDYLHDQGVLHGDIKGANILTTKDGQVKLADFGVSTLTDRNNVLAGPTKDKQKGKKEEKDRQVFGTPYWMAPEVIDMSQSTTASDIWSLGCTVIELLSGKPPYHHMQPLQALFAIVNDDHPPLPEGVSLVARDFLMQCFQKDSNLRIKAKKLLKHSWIKAYKRKDTPVTKAPGNFDEAVEEVKQWNKALASSDNNFRASSNSESHGLPFHGKSAMPVTNKAPFELKPKRTAEGFQSPEPADDGNWDDDFATAISPSALQLPHNKPRDNFGGQLSAARLKAFASMDYSRDLSSNYIQEPANEFMTIKKSQPIVEEDPSDKTIRPSRKPIQPPKTEDQKIRPSRTPSPRKASSTSPRKQHSRAKSSSRRPSAFPARPELAYREKTVEDYSDLFEGNDSAFKQKLNLPRKSNAPQLFHPSDLTSLPRSTQSPSKGSSRRKTTSRPSILPGRSFHRSKSSLEIQKFAESDEEDFSDVFGPSQSLVEKADSDHGSEDDNLMVLSKITNGSWLGEEEDEDDPFASMDPRWDNMDLEANIARDRHARLAERVEELIQSLKPGQSEKKLLDISARLLEILWESPDATNMIISAHGLLPILEILEPCTTRSEAGMVLQLLKVVNSIILEDVELQENLCFVGGIPIITKFAAPQYNLEIRLEAAAFIRQMYSTSTLTLQMFVSAGGLNLLVGYLDEDYETHRDLVLIGVNGIWNVFELQGPTPKNDFCRIFSRSNILSPLAFVLDRVLDGDSELRQLIEGRIVSIFYLFSQAENYVKELVANRKVLKSILRCLSRMTSAHQITMLKFIKNLSMLSTTLDTLHSADAIDLLIILLGESMEKGHPHFREISNQVLNTIFNLCRLSKERQEDAAVNGIVPILMKIMKMDRPPKEFALPILCDMAHSGSKGRRSLWQNKGLQFYISLLKDPYWQVPALDSIFVWLQEETAKVEEHLLRGGFSDAIASCFRSTKATAFDPNLLDPLLKLLRLSPDLGHSLARTDVYSGITRRLLHKRPVVRSNLLRIVRIILDNRGPAPQEKQLSALLTTIGTLADKDPALLVRNLALTVID
ncbi:hypothetical protein F5Y18DRAFT_19153 [Xylariaceae sp. FL1019]|nr:hypothetical protein F5Y18DRAFT_19153 [Xylariaceae sp. FL1019]